MFQPRVMAKLFTLPYKLKDISLILTTIHPVRRKITTPKILIIHDVKTPSQVPKSTGSEMKKLDLYHGLPCADCKTTMKIKV